MSKHAEKIEMARRAYLDAVAAQNGTAAQKWRELEQAVEAAKEARP